MLSLDGSCRDKDSDSSSNRRKLSNMEVQCKMALMKDRPRGDVNGSVSAPEQGPDGYTRFIT